MIESLKYNVEFGNGEKRANEAAFEKGSTMITGKNGRGKSLNLEMIAFCLFGSVALRGKAEDYKRIKAECQILIRGIKYVFKRTKSGAEVFDAEGNTLVKGNKPANEWTIRTLGFNYDVFRISHWCAQGDIQALASMKPTERKQMVDSVAGLTQMDSLINSVSSNISVAKKGIDSVNEYLTKPVEPVKPELKSLDEILAEITKTEQEQNELQATKISLESWQQPIEPRQPQKPMELQLPSEPVRIEPTLVPVPEFNIPDQYKDYDIKETLDDLSKRLDTITNVEREVANLSRRSLELQDNYPILNKWGLGELDLEAIRNRNTLIENARVKKNLLAQGDSTCPNCSTVHPIQGLALQRYENVPVELADEELVTKGEVQAHQEWRQVLAQKDEHTQQLATKERIQQLRDEFQALWNAKQAHESAKATNQSSIAMADSNYQAALQQYKQNVEHLQSRHQSEVENYNAALARYQTDFQEWNKAISQHEMQWSQWEENGQSHLCDCRITLQELNEQKTQWVIYNNQLERYNSDLDSYNAAKSNLAKEEDALNNLKNAKEALVEIKARVKSYVVPSLNSVASYLLNEMTGGEYSILNVDEDFEVTVDDQPLRTLSGSGKDIANLAIRIGLGRILTHSVLPVMMLDEIDSAMDEERAQYTWDCIQKVTPKIGQVLQVSHKHLPAQHSIEVR
ncbi:AAA family ATPase [Pseudoalteromonas sp.]|uniref:AAA family ATPase n=1 Tax=Pseudoalteromonas sp. TaxID=53249 RepID=UPI0027297C9B|nr:AAA family ATPase [Pseudoalteromonas sp.]